MTIESWQIVGQIINRLSSINVSVAQIPELEVFDDRERLISLSHLSQYLREVDGQIGDFEYIAILDMVLYLVNFNIALDCIMCKALLKAEMIVTDYNRGPLSQWELKKITHEVLHAGLIRTERKLYC